MWSNSNWNRRKTLGRRDFHKEKNKQRTRKFGKTAPERGLRGDESAGEGENEGTYDAKFRIHFRLLRSLQDRPRPFRLSRLAIYSFSPAQ